MDSFGHQWFDDIRWMLQSRSGSEFEMKIKKKMGDKK